MQKYPDSIKFKYPWRDYQERVLHELEDHLTDNKLHIIAPPGSGKTILGLEVIRRLNLPTLILSPTIAIRNQWEDRFIDLFASAYNGSFDWISDDIKNPTFLTIATYQGMHSAITGNTVSEEIAEEEDNNNSNQTEDNNHSNGQMVFIDSLKSAGIKVLLVDECHHLKNEWWKSLSFINSKIADLTIISLTATPPYDVSSTEWDRYKEFCGPVDAEISVPELVRKGDLCPHHDFIYFSNPIREEGTKLNEFHDCVNKVVVDLKDAIAFKETVLQHPFVSDSANNIENILDNPSFFASMLVYLNGVNVPIEEKLFDILGSSKNEIPSITNEWIELLLSGLLFNDDAYYKEHKACLGNIESELKRVGAIERKTISLSSTNTIYKLLTQSTSKLESIVKIVEAEFKSLKNDLRLVILTDFIRRADLNKANIGTASLKKIGVIPIFDILRLKNKSSLKIGVLCGTVVIIPKEAFNAFQQASSACGIQKDKITATECPLDSDYLLVEQVGDSKHNIVQTVTKVFEDGYIQVLVGTKSLLGEGWDSPAINSLILASFVGSFVLSNQMRGRAIRTQKGNPNKVSNIWHLVCIDPFASSGGVDFEILTRRFSAFLGISNTNDFIEKGLDRLNIGNIPFSQNAIKQVNGQMASIAVDRAAIKNKWDVALCKGTVMREMVKTPTELIPKGFVFNKTIRALFLQGLIAGGYVATQILRGLRGNNNSEYAWKMVLLALAIGFIVALPNTIKSAFVYFRNGPIEGAIQLISQALLDTLKEINIIKTEFHKIKIITEYDKQGSVYCFLDGASYFETSQFRSNLLEILGPIENPKYLILRKSPFYKLNRTDFHSVPGIIGKNKKYAEKFLIKWKNRIGTSELIYTRNLEGRKLLLKARGCSLSSAFVKKSEVISKWK
jgi:hypothetical protein